MTYTCQNCGATAESPSTLCNPSDVIKGNLCGISADHFITSSNTTFDHNTVCEDKQTTMKYFCVACSRQSADDGLLCDPDKIS